MSSGGCAGAGNAFRIQSVLGSMGFYPADSTLAVFNLSGISGLLAEAVINGNHRYAFVNKTENVADFFVCPVACKFF